MDHRQRTARKETAIPTAAGERLTTPPPLKTPRNATFPRIPEDRLDNGLRVLVVPDHRLPRVEIQLAWPVGRVNDKEENRALLSLAVDLLDKGTQSRSAWEFASELDRFAIQWDTEIGMESTFVEVAVLQEHLDRAMELVAQALIEPVFPEAELKKLQARLSSSLVSQRTQPSFLARERFYESLFPSHPYRRISLPPSDVQKSDRNAVKSAYQSQFSPAHATLVLAGPVSLDQARALARRHLGGWTNTVPRPARPSTAEGLTATLVRLVHRPHSVQSRIAVGGTAPCRSEPDFLAFRLANQVLGGSGSSRLFLNLRERRGYTYGAYSSLSTYRKNALYMAAADVRSDATAHAIEETLDEIAGMRAAAPQVEELSRANAELIGAFARQLQTPDAIGSLELTRRLQGLPGDHYRTLVSRIESVTADQVWEAARERFNPGRVVITVVGDRDKLETELGGFGPLEVYDNDGERI